MVQEYGRYFGMKTCCLRGGCLTGPNHSGVELHGFLSYLVKCNVEGRTTKFLAIRANRCATTSTPSTWRGSSMPSSKIRAAARFIISAADGGTASPSSRPSTASRP